MRIAIPITPGVKTDAQVINTAYIRYLKKAKHDPFTVNLYNSDEVLGMGDALLLPGGVDVEPTAYFTNNESSYNCDPLRDHFEKKLIKLYVDAGKPIFGICRGLQLLFLEFAQGYNLHANYDLTFMQDISGHVTNNSLEAKRGNPVHLTYLDGTLIGEAGEMIYTTNSMHHQGVVWEGEGEEDEEGFALALGVGTVINTPRGTLIVRATSESDDGTVIEAFDIPEWNVRAVQWHPEEMMDLKLLSNFFPE
jgi:putative glutamine amidotransferase